MSTILEINRAEYESRLKDILEGLESGGIGSGVLTPERLSAINLVKAKLDELVPEGEGIVYALSAEPNISNPMDLFINTHLDESVKDINLTAPKHYIYPVAITGTGTAFVNGGKTGYINLPINFLRLSVVKMADWSVEISEPTPIESKAYQKQKYTWGVSGTKKPIVALNWKVINNVMTRILEYYSIGTSHTIDKLLYIPSTATAGYTFENWFTDNPNLLHAMAWMCAGKIMQITGQLEASKFAMEQVKQSYINLS